MGSASNFEPSTWKRAEPGNFYERKGLGGFPKRRLGEQRKGVWDLKLTPAWNEKRDRV